MKMKNKPEEKSKWNINEKIMKYCAEEYMMKKYMIRRNVLEKTIYDIQYEISMKYIIYEEMMNVILKAEGIMKNDTDQLWRIWRNVK